MRPGEEHTAVLYEDNDLLIVDKPAGLVVHPAYKNPDGTLLDALRARGAWSGDERPSIVGRLDKLTSGIVVVARTAAAHAAMQRTMTSTATTKEYLAVVYGRSDTDSGVIDLPLAVSAADRRVVVVSEPGGAPSTTTFEVVARVDAPDVGLMLMRCRLATGRRHQIRVHLSARGWPIVGDAKYGDARWELVRDADLASALKAFPRQALHASRLAFAHPSTRAAIEITAPPPADFDALLRATGLVR